MNSKIAIILTFIFTVFIVSPTIISVVEKNFDISVLFNINEEENNQKETTKNFDLKVIESRKSINNLDTLDTNTQFEYYSKQYNNIAKENSSPPPEII